MTFESGDRNGWRHRFQYRNDLRKLSLKVIIEHDILPTTFVLQNVIIDRKPCGGGGFSDIYCGEHGGAKVACKRLRVYTEWEEFQKRIVRKASITSSNPL